jgi:hypothetical protein
MAEPKVREEPTTLCEGEVMNAFATAKLVRTNFKRNIF